MNINMVAVTLRFCEDDLFGVIYDILNLNQIANLEAKPMLKLCLFGFIFILKKKKINKLIPLLGPL